jgi:hypothetical protein
MARAAGYRGFADACDQSGDDGEHLDVQEVVGHDCSGGPDGDPCARPATVTVRVDPLDVHLCTDHAAEKAGEEWAENEAAALTSPPSGPWTCTPGDALPLVASDDPDERLRLAEVCNDAAGRRWEELVEEYAAAQADEDTDVDPPTCPGTCEAVDEGAYAVMVDCGGGDETVHTRWDCAWCAAEQASLVGGTVRT